MKTKKILIIGVIIVLIVVSLILFITNRENETETQDSNNGATEIRRLESMASRIETMIKTGRAGHQEVYIIEERAVVGDSRIPGSMPEFGIIVLNENQEIALALYNEGFCATKGFEETTEINESEGDCMHEDISNHDHVQQFYGHYLTE